MAALPKRQLKCPTFTRGVQTRYAVKKAAASLMLHQTEPAMKIASYDGGGA